MKARKILVSLAALALVAAISIGGTIAYLTSAEKVTNTFTVGRVQITLDEKKVDVDGKEIANSNRVHGNQYKLMPGHEYTKDPTVHFAAGSEASYIFVKVENGISGIEAATDTTNQNGYKTIADQIVANNWEALTGETGVYFKKVAANTTNAAIDYQVFANFKLADDADTTNETENYAAKNITVTAYAIQADGFDTAAAAWNEVKNMTVTTTNP